MSLRPRCAVGLLSRTNAFARHTIDMAMSWSFFCNGRDPAHFGALAGTNAPTSSRRDQLAVRGRSNNKRLRLTVNLDCSCHWLDVLDPTKDHSPLTDEEVWTTFADIARTLNCFPDCPTGTPRSRQATQSQAYQNYRRRFSKSPRSALFECVCPSYPSSRAMP
jgi:hypothetical protein